MTYRDENKIESNSNAREFVWRQIGKRNNPKYAIDIKFGSGEFNSLGLHQNGTKKLIKIDGPLNNKKHINLFMSHLLPDMAEGEIFQHDRLLCHTSCIREKLLSDKDIAVFHNQPAQSHDPDIMKPMWTELKIQIYNRKPKNLQEFWFWFYCQ